MPTKRVRPYTTETVHSSVSGNLLVPRYGVWTTAWQLDVIHDEATHDPLGAPAVEYRHRASQLTSMLQQEHFAPTTSHTQAPRWLPEPQLPSGVLGSTSDHDDVLLHSSSAVFSM